MGDNIFATGMAAFGNAYDQGNKFRTDRAQIRAGRQIAGGDYTGGAATLNSAGMIDAGHNVIADQQQLQDRQASVDLVSAKAKANALINVAQSLKQVPPGQRQAALQSKIPIFQAMKIDTSAFQNLDEQHLTDDQLDQFSTALGKAADEYTLGEGQKRIRDGKVIAQGDPKPQEYLVLPEGAKAVPKPSAGQTVSNPATGPAPSEPTIPTSGPGAPRGLRNNNPLNLTSLPHGQWDGQTGQDGRYAVFSTPEQGVAAADKNLQSYATHHGINTLAGVIQRWAPPAENDTQSYIATVSKTLGIEPNAPLNLADPTVRRQVLGAMARVELGKGSAQASSVPPPPPPPGTQAADPAGTLYGNPKPVQWQADGKGNLINGVTGDRKVDPTFDGPGAADPNVVKMVLEGRYPAPTGRAATDPKWQAVLQAAAAQDPSFNAADYQTRWKTRQDFTSGKSAQNITALNTVIGHLDHLDRSIDGLNNTDNLGPLSRVNNVFAHAIAAQSGTDARVKDFETAKTAVANELTRVFRGTGGAEADIQGWMKQLDGASSPQALHKVVQSMATLIKSRLEALGEQYQQGLGQAKDPITLLTPDKQTAYQRLLGTSAPAAAAPSGWSVKRVR